MSQTSRQSDGSGSSRGKDRDVRQLLTEVGIYCGNMLAIIKVKKTHVDLIKLVLKELKAMKDMSHENLAIFVGACVDAPNICYIMQHYTKGSLLDIIENEIIGLDWMFKTSLVSDLANVRLKPTNFVTATKCGFEKCVSRLARKDPQPYRPQLPKEDGDTPPGAVNLVTICWEEDPTMRPTFDALIKMINVVNKGERVDIMASMIEKLEKCAANLKEIVNQCTGELIVEKKTTDQLLYRMLPESVVEELKQGKVVEAELFKALTIYFSDIVGFTALSLESSPIQIIDLLNDLYSMFDDIINLHDVYKVETISDSYMVVSGLPKRNGDKHVGEFADLSLGLMNAVLNFRIHHFPGVKLQLRIGFRMGSCAAALMIHMSRYAFAALENLGGYNISPRGEIQIRGNGLQMTYWLLGKDGHGKSLPT